MTHLTKNLTLEEFLVTNTGLPNQPSWEEMSAVSDNLQQLAYRVVQPARDHFGPIKVNSGFRNAAVNAKVGGNPKSQHRKGEAADIEVPGVDNLKLARWIAENTEFDQLILENYAGGNTGWVHVSYKRKGNRKQVLNAPNPRSGKYYPGLPASTSAAVVDQLKDRGASALALVGAGAAAIWFILRKR